MERESYMQLEGYADDLLLVDERQGMKCTRLLWFENLDKEDAEVMDVCITSTNQKGGNRKFDEMLGRKIRVTVELVD